MSSELGYLIDSPSNTSLVIFTTSAGDIELSSLEKAMGTYSQVHGPLALSVCIIGVIMNIINIVVLSHKDMLSPVNRLLQAIAVMDMMTMMSYIPYCFLFYIIEGTTSSAERNTYGAACYLIFHAAFTIITHTASILLTVCVALFRYLYLSLTNGREICNLKRSNIAIGIIFLISVVLNIPQFTVLTINDHVDASTNTSWYYVSTDGMGEHSSTINLVQYIIMASLVKIGPSVALIILSGLLIKIILEAERRYRKIHKGQNSESKRKEQANQTTKLLVVVAIVFTMAELPQGILFVLSGIGKEFFEKIYWPLGNLLDFLTIVSCTINFVLYCSMSAQFRSIFITMLHIESIKDMKIFNQCCGRKTTTNENGDKMNNNGIHTREQVHLLSNRSKDDLEIKTISGNGTEPKDTSLV